MKKLYLSHKTITFLSLVLLSSQLILSCSQAGKAPSLTQAPLKEESAPSEVQNAPAPVAPSVMTKTQADGNTITTNENISPQGGIQTESKDQTETERNSNQEQYNTINENPFQLVKINPLSTFSIDVDSASYANIRRFINQGQLPPPDAVRIEELINYFTYEYPQPTNNKPFSLTTEIAPAPWNNQHQLIQIGLQGKKIATEDLPPSNLVFLIDVSGSMEEPNKLPLLKSAFRLLVNELSEKDHVSLVVYAGTSGLVLPSTPANEKEKILQAIDNLQAGGSTAGGEGLQLAYAEAKKNFIKNGNNRVILATDGDFNVGISSDEELVKMIEEKRQDGIFLSVLGVGMGNLKDAKMESLADKGNGNYAYIDNILEARKVLVSEMGATLLTIAKDVKLQVEFNPNKVQAYRLIGYENRLLQAQDFNDDTKDAGELGAGHSVTALYEIIPTGIKSDVNLPSVDDLKYQTTNPDSTISNTDEIMNVKLRYKAPNSNTSELISQGITNDNLELNNTSNNFRFAASVAEFGMILRNSQYKGNANFNTVLELAKNAQGADLDGYRAEYIRLVEAAQKLK